MKAIGFRVERKKLHWAVVSGSAEAPVLEDHGMDSAPTHYDEAATLSWFRSRTLALIDRSTPDRAGIKYPENTAQGGGTNSARERSRAEGVVLQALNEKGVQAFTGVYKAVSGKMGTKSAKDYLGGDDVRGLDWTGVPAYRKEAVLSAIAGMGLS